MVRKATNNKMRPLPLSRRLGQVFRGIRHVDVPAAGEEGALLVVDRAEFPRRAAGPDVAGLDHAAGALGATYRIGIKT